MRKFSRCTLILILVAVISGVTGYIYFNQTTTPMYSSMTRLYVVPGTENEASVRADDGGLNDDFMIIFKSNVVISAAQTKAGTSENIAQYLTVSSPANSNIIEITCMNPDKNTAKKYADAVAVTALKTTSIIPVESIRILSEGTLSDITVKPDVTENALKVMGAATGIALLLEIIVVLFIGAFKDKNEDYDDELEYERKYGRLAPVNTGFANEPNMEAAVTREQTTVAKTKPEPVVRKEIEDDFEIEDEIFMDEIALDLDEDEQEIKESKSSAKVLGKIRK